MENIFRVSSPLRHQPAGNTEITIEDIDEVISREDHPQIPQATTSRHSERAHERTISPGIMELEPSQQRPYLRLLVQPASKALRFRYECEGRSAGSLPGANSTPEIKTYPTIQIVNYRGAAVVVVSCITKDPPYKPHPHKLVGKEGCKRGICTVSVNNDSMTYTFSNLGIQCVKRRDIEEALKEREEIRVDPFRTGFEHRNQTGSIDLNSVRLCFQAFIEGSEKGKFVVPITPVISDPIYDKKAMSDLVICKLSQCSGTVRGGTDIILLCEKITKDDIEIRFYELQEQHVVWEGFGEFQPSDVHKQVAIAFKTPAYRTNSIQHPVEVCLQLRRRSDGTSSEPRIFQYIPEDTDPEEIEKKRRKVANTCFQNYFASNSSGLGSSAQPPSAENDIPIIRHIRVAQRRNIKQEPQESMMTDSQYDYPIAGPSTSSAPYFSVPMSQPIRLSPIPSNQATTTVADMIAVQPMMSTSTDTTSRVVSAVLGTTLEDSQEPQLLLLGSDIQQNYEINTTETNPKQVGSVSLGNQSANTDKVDSFDLNFSIDSSELNSLLPFSDINMNALVSHMSDTSLHFSSLEAPGSTDGQNSLTELQDQIMQLNQLSQEPSSNNQGKKY